MFCCSLFHRIDSAVTAATLIHVYIATHWMWRTVAPDSQVSLLVCYLYVFPSMNLSIFSDDGFSLDPDPTKRHVRAVCHFKNQHTSPPVQLESFFSSLDSTGLDKGNTLPTYCFKYTVFP